MKLNVMAPINGTGYGVAAKNIIRQLGRPEMELEVSLFPRQNKCLSDNEEELALFQSMGANALEFDYDATTLNIWHEFDLAHRVGNGQYVAFPFFEMTKLSEIARHHLKMPHKVIVASKWARNIVHNNVDRGQVFVAPLGVDTSIFFPAKPNDDGHYHFFTIGKWEKRKGHDFILRCFDKAFSKQDKVQLHFLTSHFAFPERYTAHWTKMCQSCALHNKVHIVKPMATHKNVADFIRSCHCGLYPSRAEGWNLELLESMACSKPVITTNYSAHTEYVTNKNAFLIETPNLELASDGYYFHGESGEWAELDYDEEECMVEYMRRCFKERIVENPEGVKTAQEFTWERTASKILEIL